MKGGTWAFPAILLAVLMPASGVLAQPAGGGRGPGGAQPAAGASTTLDRIKEQLAANDEEWAVLLPKMQALLAAYNRVQSGRTLGGTASAVNTALQEVRDLLDNPRANSRQITDKLTRLRELRTRAQATYAAAQKALQPLLTARQEATLVLLDWLE